MANTQSATDTLTGVPYTAISLDLRSTVPLYHQLYEALRQMILAGRLQAGTQLPSTRTLANELNLSRNTVLNAIDQLIAEGYLETSARAGTYVALSLPIDLPDVAHSIKTLPQPVTRKATLSQQSINAQHLLGELRVLQAHSTAFRLGLPAIDQFPFDVWGRLHTRHARHSLSKLMTPNEMLGYGPLRKAIAGYLGSVRGVQCEPDQVIIVSGSQQALDLVSHVILSPGDPVWMEDPGYIGARMVFANRGVHIIPVPIDDQGLDIEAGLKRNANTKLVYTTPSYQHPLGITMSLPRRLALLQWANKANAWILEDDYDSEYRYTSRPIAALQALDTQHRVIYVGSFSKVLFPSLRLGYLIVPPDLVDAFTSVRAFVDSHCSFMDQAVLADFIEKGYFSRHIRRMRTLYAERQASLITAAASQLQGLLEVQPAPAGMHLIGWLSEGIDDYQASKQAALHGIEALPLSIFSLEQGLQGALLLGFAAIDEHQLGTSVGQLASALRPLSPKNPQ